MYSKLIHAIILIKNWGTNNNIVKRLKNDSHVISLFHIMGDNSFLIDANFDDKEQLGAWINHMKSAECSKGIPAILSIQTQRIIEVNKQKEGFTLENYLNMEEKYHFFLQIDNPHHDDELLNVLTGSPIVHSVLHIQGGNSFTIEVIAADYDGYKKLLSQIKEISTIHHIETDEVISVLKYRNQIIDKNKGLQKSEVDLRELYTL